MAFYVQKSLAHGPIRFGVSPRRPLEAIDSDPSLSTGPKGEFARKNREGFFFGGSSSVIGALEIPTEKSISSTPFWSSLKPDGTPRRWGFLALMIGGALFILLGFAVVANKGAQGWIEVFLGTAMIAAPIILTAKERKDIRAREEKERAEREERDRRHREMLTAYSTALAKLRTSVTPETLQTTQREREALDLPYEIWAPAARQTVLAIGFDALGRLSPSRANEVADIMRKSSNAAGLTADDEAAARQALYHAVFWHFVADDRIGKAQQQELEQLRGGLGLTAEQVAADEGAMAELDRLRGVTRDTLPRPQCPIPLGFREYCVLTTTGETLRMKRDRKSRTETISPMQPCTIFVTNKRMIIDAKKRSEVPLTKIDDVELDVDANVLTIRTADAKHPIRLRLREPLYAAALIDIASTIDERPKGFA